VTITLDDIEYEPGSATHLEKIEAMHKAEIAKQTKAYVQDITERQDLNERTQLLNDELKDDAREHTAALADANATIRQGEDSFRLLVNGVKDYALYMLDPLGNVANWNAGAERIKGYVAEEIVGKHFSIFYTPEDVLAGRPQAQMATAVRTGRAEDEGWRTRRDGSTFWANVILSPIYDSAGSLLGFAKIARDLTERRNLEEQLQQSQKLEAIGSLAAGVAHDFNNLLSVILSYSELVAADLAEGDPKRADLNEIQAAGLLAVALTRQLLAFSRQQVLQPRIVDLSETVAGMANMLQRLIGEDVELSTVCEPALGTVLVDPGQMEQVLMNLALNARDAMPQGGTLTIETSAVAIDEARAAELIGLRHGPHVQLTVSDTGHGMDKATQARMFEPFFTTKEVGKGTGLGLATVFGIVKQSGGAIWVASEPAKGTVFKLYFPMTDRTAVVRSSTPPESDTLLGSETILLVEDDERVRILARTILGKYGYTVLDAKGGGDAFLLCEEYPHAIDLLLTDVVMPRMSGRLLAERLLSLRPQMKVLYMSGYTDDAVVRHGIFYSTVAFIQKPITPVPLARKVREALDSAAHS
jgi:PAS domain S-box-containing protein